MEPTWYEFGYQSIFGRLHAEQEKEINQAQDHQAEVISRSHQKSNRDGDSYKAQIAGSRINRSAQRPPANWPMW